MSQKLRAKFECTSVEGDKSYEEVKLMAVYGNNDEDNLENNQFAEATPCGDLEMTVTNPKAQGYFKVGNCYYLDFTEAPD